MVISSATVTCYSVLYLLICIFSVCQSFTSPSTGTTTTATTRIVAPASASTTTTAAQYQLQSTVGETQTQTQTTSTSTSPSTSTTLLLERPQLTVVRKHTISIPKPSKRRKILVEDSISSLSELKYFLEDDERPVVIK